MTSVGYLDAVLTFLGSDLVGIVTGGGPASPAASLGRATALRYQ
jgi:hypothetical protein